MRTFIDTLITLCKFIFMGMLGLAVLGTLVLCAMGMEGGDIVRSKWFYYIATYTIVVLGVFCIYLRVNTR